MMDRDTFLSTIDHKLHEVNAPQEQKRLNALARINRLKEIEDIIKPYEGWFKSHNVRTSFGVTGQPAKSLSWRLSFADTTSIVLSVKDNGEKEALELDLSWSKSGQPAVYVPSPFAHTGDAGQQIEAKAASVRLDDQWSPEAFESFVQDLITAFLDDAVRHGGTALVRPDG